MLNFKKQIQFKNAVPEKYHLLCIPFILFR